MDGPALFIFNPFPLFNLIVVHCVLALSGAVDFFSALYVCLAQLDITDHVYSYKGYKRVEGNSIRLCQMQQERSYKAPNFYDKRLVSKE